MNILDLMGLLSDLLAKAQAVKEGQSLPINWSKRKGKYRYRIEGTFRRENVEGGH